MNWIFVLKTSNILPDKGKKSIIAKVTSCYEKRCNVTNKLLIYMNIAPIKKYQRNLPDRVVLQYNGTIKYVKKINKKRPSNLLIYRGIEYVGASMTNSKQCTYAQDYPKSTNELLNYLNIRVGNTVKVTLVNSKLGRPNQPSQKEPQQNAVLKRLSSTTTFDMENILPNKLRIGFIGSLINNNNAYCETLEASCIASVVTCNVKNNNIQVIMTKEFTKWNMYTIYNGNKKTSSNIEIDGHIIHHVGVSNTNPVETCFNQLTDSCDFIFFSVPSILRRYRRWYDSKYKGVSKPVTLDYRSFNNYRFPEAVYKRSGSPLQMIPLDDLVEWIEDSKKTRRIAQYLQRNILAQVSLFKLDDYISTPYMIAKMSNSTLQEACDKKPYRLIRNIVASRIWQHNNAISKRGSIKQKPTDPPLLLFETASEWESVHSKFIENYDLLKGDKGGDIYVARYGIHQHLISVDFNSCYPLIIRDRNLDPSTVIIRRYMKRPKRSSMSLKVGDFFYSIYTTKRNGTNSKTNIIPRLMDDLYKMKVSLHNQPYKKKVVKLFLNEVYGVWGIKSNKVCMPCKMIALLVTHIQRKRLISARIRCAMEFPKGCVKPVYSHTDSIMFSINNPDLVKMSHLNTTGADKILSLLKEKSIFSEDSLVHIEAQFRIAVFVTKTSYVGYNMKNDRVCKGFSEFSSPFTRHMLLHSIESLVNTGVDVIDMRSIKYKSIPESNFYYYQNCCNDVNLKSVRTYLTHQGIDSANMVRVKHRLIKVVTTHDKYQKKSECIHPLMMTQDRFHRVIDFSKYVDHVATMLSKICTVLKPDQYTQNNNNSRINKDKISIADSVVPDVRTLYKDQSLSKMDIDSQDYITSCSKCTSKGKYSIVSNVHIVCDNFLCSIYITNRKQK